MATSYDDLALQGLGSGDAKAETRFCQHCRANMRVFMSRCEQCGIAFENKEPSAEQGAQSRAAGPTFGVLGSMLEQMGGTGQLMTVLRSVGNGNGGAFDLERALQLSMGAGTAKRPTCSKFMASLEEATLTNADFLPVILRVDGMPKDIRCSRAAFGALAVSEGRQGLSEKKQVSVKGPIRLADPIHGESSLDNASELKGSVCVFLRGKVSFAKKVNLAASAGCSGAIVVQGDNGTWPYEMTDSTGAAKGVTIPVCMVSSSDGAALMSHLERKTATCCLFTIGVDLSCPVCREDFVVGKTKAASLPCGHKFHSGCIRPWLKRQHVCPMCRLELPMESKDGSRSESVRFDQQRLLADMYS